MSEERKVRWRVGSKVPINIYEGDRPICQCHTAMDARRIVDAVNGDDPTHIEVKGQISADNLTKFIKQ